MRGLPKGLSFKNDFLSTCYVGWKYFLKALSCAAAEDFALSKKKYIKDRFEDAAEFSKERTSESQRSCEKILPPSNMDFSPCGFCVCVWMWMRCEEI
jgi:hypothetical protein